MKMSEKRESKATLDLREANKGVGLNARLETPEGIFALLQNYHALTANNTTRVSDIVVDFHAAIKTANLTENQHMAVRITIDGLTQREVAEARGCTQQAVQQHLQAAIRKIAKASAKPKPIVVKVRKPRVRRVETESERAKRLQHAKDYWTTRRAAETPEQRKARFAKQREWRKKQAVKLQVAI